MNDDTNVAEKNQYEQEERTLLKKSEAFLKMLTERGLLEDQGIGNEAVRQAAKVKKRNAFHNTQLILKYYRDISWALEYFPVDIAEELEGPMGNLDALLSLVNANLAMDNIKLENRMLSVQKTRLLIDRVNEALTVLRQKPVEGEQMYQCLYLKHITPEKLRHADILYRLGISERHYYRTRQQAINILSIRLWATPSVELDAWLEVLTLLESL